MRVLKALFRELTVSCEIGKDLLERIGLGLSGMSDAYTYSRGRMTNHRSVFGHLQHALEALASKPEDTAKAKSPPKVP